MKSLAELEDEEVFNLFVASALARTRESAGVSVSQEGFGGNTGVEGREGEGVPSVDSWFDNARW